MHESVIRFVMANLSENEVKGKTVLEVGSANVNGSVRPFVESLGPESYCGIDLAPGPGVDRVVSVNALGGKYAIERYSVVLSCEMLEHAEHWQGALESMCTLTGETFLLTCRGPGFQRHNPPDHWRFRPDDLFRAVEYFGLRVVRCGNDPQVAGVFLKAVRPGLIDVMRSPEP